MSGVTSQGFESKQCSEIVNEIAATAKTPEYFGEQFPVTPDSIFGILSGVFGAALKDQWDLSSSVADQGNRDKAAGKYLDDLAALNGLTRLLPSGSTGILLFTGSNNSTVPKLTPVKCTTNNVVVLTNSALTLNRNLCYRITLNVTSVFVSQVFTITINSTPYTYTAVSGDTGSSVMNSLVSIINSGENPQYSASYSNNTIIITSSTTNNNLFTSNSSSINLVSVGGIVEATSATTGAIRLFSNTVTVLIQAVIGVISVTNPNDFSIGREEETDAELRKRMEDYEQSTGTATKPAIETSLSDLQGVSYAYLVENTTMSVDVEGRPPKSYEVYVSGGLDSQIATTIWETKPAGIETWGNQGIVVIDKNGDSQLVKFSRFDQKYAWVRVTYEINNEEVLPQEVESAIKDAVVETGVDFYRGEDLEPTKFYGNIYSNVSGIYVSKVEVAITDLPADSPAWSQTRLSVSNVTSLNFNNDRVVLLT